MKGIHWERGQIMKYIHFSNHPKHTWNIYERAQLMWRWIHQRKYMIAFPFRIHMMDSVHRISAWISTPLNRGEKATKTRKRMRKINLRKYTLIKVPGDAYEGYSVYQKYNRYQNPALYWIFCADCEWTRLWRIYYTTKMILYLVQSQLCICVCLGSDLDRVIMNKEDMKPYLKLFGARRRTSSGEWILMREKLIASIETKVESLPFL